jgi:hypothetical protein
MSGTPSSSSSSSSVTVPVPLPGFLSIEEIRKLSTEHFRSGTPLVSVIGFVKDFRVPYQTKGTDFKCEFELKDFSSPDGLKVIVFWKEELMPEISNAGDAVLIRKAKVSSLHLHFYDTWNNLSR